MLQDSDLARRIDGKIHVRAAGLRLRWELNELTTADGHSAKGIFTGTVRALPEPNEIKMLEEALLTSGPAAGGPDVIRHFAGAISTAARKYARDSDAINLLSDDGRRGMLVAIVEAARAVAFASGVEIIPPVQVDLDCPTLKSQQIEALQRQTLQRRTADQVDHLRRSAELFSQFEAIRAAVPGLSPGQALSRIGPSDQADVFRAILAASPQSADRATLWAVAGPHLIRIGGDESPRADLISVPNDLGPLRSVRSDGFGGLLIGCRAGVLRINPESPGDAKQYRDPEITSQLGFNSAMLRDGILWAAHGEAGLVCWNEDEPDQPRTAIRPASAPVANFSPRNLTRIESNRPIFSSGSRTFAIEENESPVPMGEEAGAEVIAIISQSGWIITAHEDGELRCFSSQDSKLQNRQHRSGRIAAAAIFPWLGDARLLLATEDGPLICVGIEDELITQYASPYKAMRMAAGTTDRVAAVSPDRQRLILWHAWDGRKPYADLHLYNTARHRLADITFA